MFGMSRRKLKSGQSSSKVNLGEERMTREDSEARIAEIDRRFLAADGWRSWMAGLPHRFRLTAGGRA